MMHPTIIGRQPTARRPKGLDARHRGVRPTRPLFRPSDTWLALVALFLSFGVGASAAASTAPQPRQSFRADHMILGAAVQGDDLVLATQSGRVDVIDWSTGEADRCLLELQRPAGQVMVPSVRAVAISPSGAHVAAASSDGRLRLLERRDDGSLARTTVLPVPGIVACEFLDEKHLVTGSMQGFVALLDLESGERSFERQLDYDPVYALVISPDGRRIAVALRSSRIQVIEARSGVTVVRLSGHRDSVNGVAWLGNEQLLSAGKDKRLLLWDLRRGGAEPRELFRGDQPITAVAVDQESGRIAFTADDHRILVADAPGAQPIHIFAGHSAPVVMLSFVDGGGSLISAGNDARALVWTIDASRQGGVQ